MGQPPGGFPKKIKQRILQGREAIKGRPGASLPPVDFKKTAKKIEDFLPREPSRKEVLSYLMYPKVYEEFVRHQRTFSNTSGLPTPVFLYGQNPEEEISVDIEEGKTLIVKFLTVGDHTQTAAVDFFELNDNRAT
jgi:pyruvate carboxylase